MDEIRMLFIFFILKLYSAEKWEMLSKPMKAQGEITAMRTIWPKAFEFSIKYG